MIRRVAQMALVYVQGVLNLLSQFMGWMLCYTNNGNESISAAAARRGSGAFGPPEPFSARLYRFINAVFFWQDDHCMRAIWFDALWSRGHLEMLRHVVLDPDQSVAYRLWLDSNRPYQEPK